MKQVLYAIGLVTLTIVVSAVWILPARRASAQTTGNDTAALQYQRALDEQSERGKRAAALIRGQEELHTRAEALFTTQEQMLKRQEADYTRFEKILDTWESEQKQYQKYLDTLPE